MEAYKEPSGHQKRKARKEREEAIKKLPRVTEYFLPVSSVKDVNNQTSSEGSETTSNAIKSPLFVDENDDSKISDTRVTRAEKVDDFVEQNALVSREISAPKIEEIEQNALVSREISAPKIEEINESSIIETKARIDGGRILKIDLDENIDANIQKDCGNWPLKLYENRKEREKYLAKGTSFFQNKNSTFKTSKRGYSGQNRYFSATHFVRTLHNGEKCERNWLMFSESKGSVFCYVCKIFSLDQTNAFVQNGFTNWKKIEETLCSHENSKEHNKNLLEWVRYSENFTIETGIDKQTENHLEYWTNVLRRVVAVVQFLAERGLAFRGKEEIIGSVHNGNFLGLLELLSKFDPFLNQHIVTYANQGRGSVSYLSKTIYEEFIRLMSQKVTEKILSEVNQSKYWGLIMDSTPDLSHVDQLSVVLRYYLNGKVSERFLGFLQITSHTGRSLSNDVLELLDTYALDIQNCRAQTYDNASNMSGKYKGVQACIRELNNLAFYVPCVGHSLNLVGECSVEVCTDATTFFGVLQEIYVFFTISTHRWNILMDQNTKSKVKSLSATRWSCRKDATKVMYSHFDSIYQALQVLANEQEQKSKCRQEASALMNNIIKLENAFMTVLWNDILNRFDATSQYLQKVDVDLVTAGEMLFSLLEFVRNLRDKFTFYEEKAKTLSVLISQEYSDEKKRKIKKRFADDEVGMTSNTGSDNFRINTFYVIIDKLVTELKKRCEAYDQVIQLFAFLLQLLTIEDEELDMKVDTLVKFYPDDLEKMLFVELKQLIELIKTKPAGFFSNRSEAANKIDDQSLCPLKIVNWIVEQRMIQMFPNAYIAYRILLTIPIANCGSERSFSVLKRIKNLYRSTMLDQRLSSLAVLSIEAEILRSLNFDDLISDFVKNKSRKKYF